MTVIQTLKNLMVSIYWGNTIETDETLTPDAIEAGVYWTDHFPVNLDPRYWRIIGWIGVKWAFLGNVTIEPLTGRIELFAGYPAFDSVHLDYSHYVNMEIDIITKDYKTPLPRNAGEPDVFGQIRRAKLNRAPATVDFKWVLTNENLRNLLSESIMKNYNFLLLDNNIDETYGLRAFEGGFVSDEQGSMYKGEDYLLPLTMEVDQFGIIDARVATSFDSAADDVTPLGWTNLGTGTWPYFTDLSTGDWITITGSTYYNGTWKIVKTDDYLIRIHFAFDDDDSGTVIRPQQIDWSHFNH